MKRKNKKEGKLFLGILLAVVVLGVGYAAISGVNLIINGSAKAVASAQQEDFIVHFDNLSDEGEYITYSETAAVDSFNQTFVNSKNVTAASSETNKSASVSISNDQLSATVDVLNMTKVGDTVTFMMPVINESDGIKADLSVDIENNNEEYFNVTAVPATETLNGNGATTTLQVTVNVVKVPTEDDVTGTFTVTLAANPTE